VCLVYKSDENDRPLEYIDEASKCDCPNGWLFCSYSLAFVLFMRLVQTKSDWDIHDLIFLMPEPIKSLQSMPISADLVFNKLSQCSTEGKGRNKIIFAKKPLMESSISNIGLRLAQEIPNYSGEFEDEEGDDDARDELQIQLEARRNRQERKGTQS